MKELRTQVAWTDWAELSTELESSGRTFSMINDVIDLPGDSRSCV